MQNKFAVGDTVQILPTITFNDNLRLAVGVVSEIHPSFLNEIGYVVKLDPNVSNVGTAHVKESEVRLAPEKRLERGQRATINEKFTGSPGFIGCVAFVEADDNEDESDFDYKVGVNLNGAYRMIHVNRFELDLIETPADLRRLFLAALDLARRVDSLQNRVNTERTISDIFSTQRVA